MAQSDSLRARFEGAQKNSIIVGGIGLAVLVAGAFINTGEFFQAYLYGFLFWMTLTIGALGWKMLHNLVSGAWGFVIRRLLEAATKTLPVMLVLFVPIVFGMSHLYEWTHPEAVAASHVIQHKAAYLNVPFFLIRTGIYFAIWIFFAWRLTALTAQQENTPPPAPPLTRRIQRYSGIGLLTLILTATFASVDWVMSLEPEWFSTIYGLLFIVGGSLTAICTMTLLVITYANEKPLSDVMYKSIYHDLGNLMFALTMLWAYISLSQYLIIWMGNIAEEVPWYIKRISGGWGVIGWAIVAGHFAVPFLLLLQRGNKRNPQRLRSVAIFLLVMRVIDLYWVVMPAFHEGSIHFNWMAPVALLGIGGVWVAALMWGLKDKPLMPLYDPRMHVALDKAAHASEAAAHASHAGAHIHVEGGV
jgi:hypothetical protein